MTDQDNDHPGRLPDLPDPVPLDMLQRFLEADPIVQWLRKHGKPVTRQNWIDLNWCPGEEPDPWTAEDEDQLPALLQDWSWCDR